MKKIQPAPRIEDADMEHIVDLLVKGEMKELVEKYNNKYYHWDELQYHCDDGSRKDLWLLMKISRRQSSYKVNICGIDFYYSNRLDFQKILHDIDRKSPNDMGLEKSGDRNSDIRFVISSLMEESIASSQMEGAAVTRKDAKKMLLQRNPKPKTVDERMILNNYCAMEHIKSIAEQKMTVDLMLKMHETITKDTLSEGSEWEGKFRENNEIVVGDPMDEELIFHKPPKYDEIPDMMSKLCDFINDDGTYIHPIIKGIMIHFMIGYIHPFVNGNGRLARSLFYWYVIRKGYRWMEYTSISRIMKKSQTKYGLAYQYTETDDNDLTYFIKFNLDCIVESVNDLIGYIRRKKQELDETVKTVEKNPDLSMQEVLIVKDYMKEQKTFSIGEISTKYGVSYQTARNYVNDLHDKGYVGAVGKSRKTQLFLVDMSKMQ